MRLDTDPRPHWALQMDPPPTMYRVTWSSDGVVSMTWCLTERYTLELVQTLSAEGYGITVGRVFDWDGGVHERQVITVQPRRVPA